MTEPTRPEPLLQLIAVEKEYDGRRVLGPISLRVDAGEVLGLCGQNGAGKTTFLRLASGLQPPSRGQVQRRATSFGMVHQHYSLVDELTVAENVWLGAEPHSWRGFDAAAAESATAALGRELGFEVDPTRRTSELSVSEKQRVEWLKALRHHPQLLLLDEPTATLTPPEIETTLKLVRKLADAGTAVVFVTHKLKETFSVCDRIAVLTQGELVLQKPAQQLSEDDVAIAMVGRPIHASTPPAPVSADHRPVLVAKDLRYGRLQRAGFTVRQGEILGVAGVEGNGQAELFATLVGLVAPAQGTIELDDVDITGMTPHARRQKGLRFVPADRHHEGLLLDQTATNNLRLGQVDAAADRDIRGAARALLHDFGVDPEVPTLIASSFSGGNQQKLLFARELAHVATSAPPGRLYVVREPTRGVDFAAQERLWNALRLAAQQGAAVIVMSSDLDELRALCHRICVLFRGVTGDAVDNAVATQAWLGRHLGGLS